MNWTEFSIHTTQDAVEPVSNILHEAGASGVVIEDPQDLYKLRDSKYGELFALNPDDYPTEGVILKAYLPESNTLEQTIESIKKSINNLVNHDIDLGKNDVRISVVDEEEWATAWKKYYKPIKVSEKITILPTWEDYERKQNPDELIIELDPGMAFGTGTHPTTFMCIQAIEKYLNKDNNVIDVGTGSGILSIAAAKLGAKSVLAYDLDEVAVKSAIFNVELNNEHDKVKVEQNNLLQNVTEKVDLIVGNLLAEIVLLFIDDAKKLLNPQGYFIVSGIIEKKKNEVLNGLTAAGLEIVEVMEMEDWVAIISKKS